MRVEMLVSLAAKWRTRAEAYIQAGHRSYGESFNYRAVELEEVISSVRAEFYAMRDEADIAMDRLLWVLEQRDNAAALGIHGPLTCAEIIDAIDKAREGAA